jgi:hypothetical protein
MLTIETDTSRALVRATLEGFLEVEEVAAFFRQEQELVRSLGYRSGDYVLLFDARKAVIQSQDVVGAFMTQMLAVPLKARRVAVVGGASLARMQAQRVAQVRQDAATFSSIEDAEAWLFAPMPNQPLA